MIISFSGKGLKRILNMEEDLEVIGECGDGIQVLEFCNQEQPEVVLMDINMPIENGVVATERLRDLFPHIKVIILSSMMMRVMCLRRFARALPAIC